MPTRIGAITGIGRTGAKFVEAYLDTGEKVEIPHALWAGIQERRPDERLVFVERRGRLFRFVQWVGTPQEAAAAVRDGLLRDDEVPEEVRRTEVNPDWTEMAQRSILALFESSKAGRHDEVGEWLSRLQAIAMRAPFPDLAAHVEMLAKGDEGDQKVAVDGMLSWVRKSMSTTT